MLTEQASREQASRGGSVLHAGDLAGGLDATRDKQRFDVDGHRRIETLRQGVSGRSVDRMVQATGAGESALLPRWILWIAQLRLLGLRKLAHDLHPVQRSALPWLWLAQTQGLDCTGAIVGT